MSEDMNWAGFERVKALTKPTVQAVVIDDLLTGAEYQGNPYAYALAQRSLFCFWCAGGH